MASYHESLMEYYQRELTYLRRSGTAFAEKYPKIAARLELEADQCPDPHVERLIEAFAFLTGRIQYNLDNELAELSSALLNILYPQFLNPIPAMAVAQFTPDPDQGGLTSSFVLPRNTPLFAGSEQGHICRFRTCYPVTLWPVKPSHAGFESPAQYDFLDNASDVAVILRIRIEAMAGDFSDIAPIPSLRFFLSGDRMLVNELYELLFCHVSRVAIIGEKKKTPVFSKGELVKAVGFSDEESILPYPGNAHDGYRLLHEYFTFPKKYHFFDLPLPDTTPHGRWFDILILLNQEPAGRLTVDRNTFCLGCSPVVNLFRKTTDPIRPDLKRVEYRLVPDMRREKVMEIHSIESVSASPNPAEKAVVVDPIFSCSHSFERGKSDAYWHGIRRESEREDLPGTEMFISFVDSDFKAVRPPYTTVFAHTLCTNRRLAEEIPSGALLNIDTAAPVSRIHLPGKPTPPLSPPLKGSALWMLISHLSLNYLSLSQGEESLSALKEILRLYSFSRHTDTWQQISGIREMACRSVVRRMGKQSWRGFLRGTEITLLFDERSYVGSSAFLLASVLNRFFSLYTSINTFTQLVIKSMQREGIWKTWKPMAGTRKIF